MGKWDGGVHPSQYSAADVARAYDLPVEMVVGDDGGSVEVHDDAGGVEVADEEVSLSEGRAPRTVDAEGARLTLLGHDDESGHNQYGTADGQSVSQPPSSDQYGTDGPRSVSLPCDECGGLTAHTPFCTSAGADHAFAGDWDDPSAVCGVCGVISFDHEDSRAREANPFAARGALDIDLDIERLAREHGGEVKRIPAGEQAYLTFGRQLSIEEVDQIVRSFAESTARPPIVIADEGIQVHSWSYGQWLEIGVANGWVSQPFCETHDGGPLTPGEEAEFEGGDDPCIVHLRVWSEEIARQWRNRSSEDDQSVSTLPETDGREADFHSMPDE
jgi:hypothetical protein